MRGFPIAGWRALVCLACAAAATFCTPGVGVAGEEAGGTAGQGADRVAPVTEPIEGQSANPQIDTGNSVSDPQQPVGEPGKSANAVQSEPPDSASPQGSDGARAQVEPVTPAQTEPVAPAQTEPVAPAQTEPVAPAQTEAVEPAPAASGAGAPALVSDPAPQPPENAAQISALTSAEPLPLRPLASLEPTAPSSHASLDPPIRRLSAAPAPGASGSSHAELPQCETVRDTDACDRELNDLFDRQQAACSGKDVADERCLEAMKNLESRRICIDKAGSAACEVAVAQNPCFEDPRSRACKRFVERHSRLCRPAPEPYATTPSFDCQVFRSADFLFCTATEGLLSPCGGGAGGSEEEESPHARAGAGGRAVRVGLTDPGARGDAGLREISAVRPDREPGRVRHPRTGLESWLLGFAGLLALGGGLYARRFVSGV